jgi:hypothetical protein
MSFSVRNTEGGTARITRKEMVEAREEAWWGKPIMVAQEQILDR